MKLWTTRQHRCRATAQEQFARFVTLNRGRYSKLVASGFSDLDKLEFTVRDHQAVADACRQWLPHLTDSVDRDICCAILQVHDSFAFQDDALEFLQIAFLADLERERRVPEPDFGVTAKIAFSPYTQASSSSTT